MALITYLTKIQFDFGAIKLLPAEMGLLGMKRPLLVTDQGVLQSGLVERVIHAIGSNAKPSIFADTPANPTESACRAALEQFREQACDGLIALGGGSAMDLAKAVALWASHGGDSLKPYMMVEGGVQRINANIHPVIAMPTTAGTGSEVGRGAVIVLDDGRKLALVSPHLIPKLALCDPELTLDLPAAMTAGTGMDAMAHCIETFVAPSINPPAEAIARDGMIKVFNYLERAVHDGHDRDARWNMMMAAMEGAMAFQKGLGAVHALSHPLGALKSPRLHHGTLNAIFLPPVLRFNGPVLGDKLQRLATVFAVKADIDAIAKVIEDLNRRIGLPQKLSELGVDRSQFDSIASQALLDHCHGTNPRQATHADYVKILEDVY